MFFEHVNSTPPDSSSEDQMLKASDVAFKLSPLRELNGTNFMFSVWAKATASTSITISGGTESVTEEVGTSWKRITTQLLKNTSEASADVTILVPEVANNGYIYFYKAKLESGTRSTDWTPAPEDIEGRVETQIKQLDDKIELRATKTEVDNLTTRVAAAELELEPESITSKVTQSDEWGTLTTTVTQTASGLTIVAGRTSGGTNLCYGSGGNYWDLNYWDKNETNASISSVINDTIPTLAAVGSIIRHLPEGAIFLEPDTEYVYSARFKSTKDLIASGNTPLHMHVRRTAEGGTTDVAGNVHGGYISVEERLDRTVVKTSATISRNEWHIIEVIFKTIKRSDFPSGAVKLLFVPIWYDGNVGDDETTYFDYIKIEKGNVATDWAPALGDIEDRFNNTITRDDSDWEQLAALQTVVDLKRDGVYVYSGLFQEDGSVQPDYSGYYTKTTNSNFQIVDGSASESAPVSKRIPWVASANLQLIGNYALISDDEGISFLPRSFIKET